jgi:F0F1-type ATP synthase membrane subunit a
LKFCLGVFAVVTHLGASLVPGETEAVRTTFYILFLFVLVSNHFGLVGFPAHNLLLSLS